MSASQFWLRRWLRYAMLTLFLLSLSLPAVGDRTKPNSEVPGLGAIIGSVFLLFGPAEQLRLAGLAVVANVSLVWGWLAMTFPQPEKTGSRRLLRGFSVLSVMLAAAPIFVIGSDRVLIGYWLWFAAIGMMAISVWICEV